MFDPFLTYTFLSIFLFLLLVSAIALFAALFYWYRSKVHLRKGFEQIEDLAFLKVQVPEDNEIEIKAFEQFYTNLLGIKESGKLGTNNSPHISLEVVGTEEGIDFYIVCPKSIKSLVEKAVHAVYSEAEIIEGKQNLWNIWEKDGYQEFGEYYLSKEDHFPIKTYEEIELDPLNSLTSVMSKMSEGEAMAFQLLIRPTTSNWDSYGNTYANSLVNKKDSEGNPTSTDKDREQSEVIKSKTKKQGFDSVVRLFSVAPSQEISKANLKNLKNALGVFDYPEGNKFTSKSIRNFLGYSGKKYFIFAFIYRIFPYLHVKVPFLNYTIFKGYSVLNTAELSTLYHFPNKEVKTPGINWIRSKSHIAPTDLPNEGLYLGISEFRGVERKIHMKDDDRRRHFYILGQTGTGKSELAKFLAIQDIKEGKGVAFIDPHGSAVTDIMQQIPEERIDDVIYFNPGDQDYPMGLNILDVETKRARDLVINSFIELLYKLYDPNRQGIVGPQLERAVRNAMLTVMEAQPGGSLIEVMRLLMDEKYQKTLIEKVKDPLVKRYWTDEMANTQSFHKSEKTGYFVSKFDRFATESVMRNIIGQSKSAFDFNKVMKEKKILLIDLNKGVLGEENSKFLGLLLVPRILAAAFARASADGSAEPFDDFYLYVDEFQNFSTPDFVTILSEARKYKLNLIVANQFLSQMSEDIKNAIFGNVGTIVSFRVGQDDAKYMADQFEPYFDEGDLINLKVGRTVLRLLVDGHPTAPFSMKTDWDQMSKAKQNPETAQKIIDLSRKKYAKTAEEVEKEIDKRSGLSEFEDKKSKSPFSSPFGKPGSSKSPFASRSSSGGSPFSKKFSGSKSGSSSGSSQSSDQDKSFNSGKTPFSDDASSKKPPLNRSGFPFGKGKSPFPSKGSRKGFSLGSAETGYDADKTKNLRSKSGDNFSVGDDGNRPLQQGGDSNSKRGAISLADIHKENGVEDYEESKNTFSGVDKKPLNPKPKRPVEGEENKPKDDDESKDPKGHGRVE